MEGLMGSGTKEGVAMSPDEIPDHREDARRIVRHRMRELAPWLRFDVGPEPGEEWDRERAYRRMIDSAESLWMSVIEVEARERYAFPRIFIAGINEP